MVLRRRLYWLQAVLVIGALPWAARAQSGKALTVGFSQIGAESAWRTAETESIRSEAAKRSVTLKFSDAQQK